MTFIFFHISKTGGTAIKSALVNKHPQKGKIRWMRHATKLSDVERGEKKIIFFIRHPISRFISGYYSRKNCGRPAHYKQWTENERLFFEKFGTINKLCDSLSSFNILERRKARKLRGAVKHLTRRHSYEEIFTSIDYLKERGKEIYFVGFQEKLELDFNSLCRKLNIHASLPKDEYAAHKGNYDIEFPSQRRLATLQKFLEKDIEIYWYLYSTYYQKSIN